MNYGVDCPLELSYFVSKEVVKEIYFPNVIISNGGGNSIFFPNKPIDYDVIGLAMKIYDRWGNLLFQVSNFEIGKPEYGWDGTFNGKQVTPGVYLYTLEILDKDNVKSNFLGDLTVIK
jgi:gliding motility-associated-like protein